MRLGKPSATLLVLMTALVSSSLTGCHGRGDQDSGVASTNNAAQSGENASSPDADAAAGGHHHRHHADDGASSAADADVAASGMGGHHHRRRHADDGSGTQDASASGAGGWGGHHHRHHADGEASAAANPADANAEDAPSAPVTSGRHHRRGGGDAQTADDTAAKSPWWWPFAAKTKDATGGRNGRHGGGKGATAIAVRVTPAHVGTIQTVLTLGGDLQPFFETSVASKVAGRLDSLLADEGTRVKSNQLLATIDKHDYLLALAQAEAALASARSSRSSAQSNYLIQADTLKRTISVYKEGGVSDQQMIQTRAQTDAARSAVQTADAAISQNVANVSVAQTNLQYTEVRAPFDGAVSKRLVDIGTQLGALTPVFSVATVSKLKVRMSLGEAYLASVRVGTTATFSVPTYPNRTFTSKIVEISPEVDPKLRTAQVTFLVPNPKGELSPGMYARINLPTDRHDKVVLMPSTTIVTDGEDSYVFEAIDDKAVRKPVKVGLRSGDNVEITSGVNQGDPVITLGQGLLQDGDRIRVADGDGAATGAAEGAGGGRP